VGPGLRSWRSLVVAGRQWDDVECCRGTHARHCYRSSLLTKGGDRKWQSGATKDL